MSRINLLYGYQPKLVLIDNSLYLRMVVNSDVHILNTMEQFTVMDSTEKIKRYLSTLVVVTKAQMLDLAQRR